MMTLTLALRHLHMMAALISGYFGFISVQSEEVETPRPSLFMHVSVLMLGAVVLWAISYSSASKPCFCFFTLTSSAVFYVLLPLLLLYDYSFYCLSLIWIIVACACLKIAINMFKNITALAKWSTFFLVCACMRLPESKRTMHVPKQKMKEKNEGKRKEKQAKGELKGEVWRVPLWKGWGGGKEFKSQRYF